MIKLDENLLVELGLGALPKDEKTAFLKHMYETLEMRVGTRLAERMSNQQMSEFEQFIQGNDEQGAFQWLETNFPNYKEVVAEEFEKLKSEVRPLVPQIVAASQAQAQQGTGPQHGAAHSDPAQPSPAGPSADHNSFDSAGPSQVPAQPAASQPYNMPASSPSAAAQPYSPAPPAFDPPQPQHFGSYGPAPASPAAPQPAAFGPGPDPFAGQGPQPPVTPVPVPPSPFDQQQPHPQAQGPYGQPMPPQPPAPAPIAPPVYGYNGATPEPYGPEPARPQDHPANHDEQPPYGTQQHSQ